MDQQEATAQAPNKSPLETLIVFKDEPLFSDSEFDRKSDAFNHEAFAETILKLITKNEPPLSIALFGAWGIGKSTIINILFGKINEHEGSSLKPIYFNAWKYSGDSFRRQFLIEVAKQIYGDGDDNVRRLEELNYADVLKQSHQKGLAASVVQGFKDAFDAKIAFRGTAIVRFLIGCFTLLLGVGTAALVARHSQIVASLILSTVAPAVFVWFSRLKFEEVFVFQETPIYDPKLIFPEQFEKEFVALIKSPKLNGRRVVIAIDDLDRCEPKLVQDILISTKNFIGQEDCFFVVPCDDKTIVKVFEEPNQKQGYKDESLRKYFNVGIRIPPITSTDLVDFANNMARQTGIPEGVVQVAVLANCRDPRKMKHFLNSFVMKYQIARAREVADMMPKIVDASLPELAKAVLIEDAYPELFAKIVENPRVYQVLERAALNPDVDNPELESLKLNKWDSDFPGLKDVLERTRYISMAHADVFFSLKSTNAEIKVPRGTELKTAVIEGNITVVDEIAKGITDAAAGVAAADLMLDLLTRSNGVFLERAITGALRLYCVGNVFSGDNMRRVADAVTDALLHRDTSGILVQPPDHVLTCSEYVGPDRLDAILARYLKSIESLPSAQMPPKTDTLVPSVYRFTSRRKQFADLFNAKFFNWIDTREGLVALENLNLPPDISHEERIPAERVVARILVGTLPQESELGNNMIRRKILFANWKDDYGQAFDQTLIKILQESQSTTTYSPQVKFAVESVILLNRLVEAPDSNQLWSLLPDLYDRTTDSDGKIEISKAAIIFASMSKDANVRSEAKRFLINFWGTVNDPTLRESLEFVKSVESPEGPQLIKSAIEQELLSINNEIQTPGNRTVQRIGICLEYSDHLPPNSIEDVFIRALEVNQDESLSKWLAVVMQYEATLSTDFPNRLATSCLGLLPPNTHRLQRQQILLTAFAESLGKLASHRKRELGQQYFALLKDSNPNTRIAAATVLNMVRGSLFETHEFKIWLGGTLKDLRTDVKTAELPQFRPVFDALIAQSDLFGEYQWHDVADLSKQLLSQSDASLQEFGMTLVEGITAIPESDQEDLLHLLITIENSSSALTDRASTKLNSLSAEKLVERAKDMLKGRRAELPGESS